jgi:quercetin dioxygenase-like cupin family protein
MRIQLVIGLTGCVAFAAQGQGVAGTLPQNSPPMTLHPAGQLAWKDGPAAMPKGTSTVVLEGDPTKAGVFTMRIKFPAGLRVAPHSHTQTEHATVISGILHIGMGATFDSAATRALTTGSFGFWPAGTKHFAWMEGETVLQLHGQGPWTITYVNPADDPRKPAP